MTDEIATDSDGVQASLRRASQALSANNLGEAARIIAALEAAHPENGDVWGVKSEIALREGRWEEAISAVDKAIEAGGPSVHRLVQRARCYGLAGRIAVARAAAFAAIEAGASCTDHLNILASVLTRCDENAKALELYERALEASPDDVDALRGCVTVRRFLGNLEAAESACDRLLKLKPDDYEIIFLRSGLRRQTRDRNHLSEIDAALKSGRADWRGVVQLAYALSKEYEDLGDFGKSFFHLSNGAKIRRRHTHYDVEDDVRIFDSIMSAFSAESIRAREGNGFDCDAPVFVLGMPRTGSTLVERIISSHSMVESAGELNDFAIELVSLVKEQNDAAPDRLALPAASLGLDMRELGRRYVEAAAQKRAGAPRFIDKLPLNSLYVGLIHLALPQAKIVHVSRDPMDACFAMYKYLFKHAYPFSYDLRELARYYSCYLKLMNHWRAVLPGKIYDVSYEALVADQEGQSRALIAALGLEWEAGCLDFHENSAAATTGSASQVREPIYSSSVGKWRNFESQLEPLRLALEEFGVMAPA